MPGTDYLGHHERQYQRLKAEGAHGWNSLVKYEDAHAKFSAAIAALDIGSGDLLELGCGQGDLALRFARDGFRAHGIDVSPTAIAWANDKAAAAKLDADFRAGSVLALPYRDDAFDVVVDALCFHCIIGPDRAAFLRQVHRVLKPGALFTGISKCGTPADPEYPFDPATRCKIENGVATRYWGTPESLLDELSDNGFAVREWRVDENYSQPSFFHQSTKA